jgi:hypothetical protein
VSQQARELRQWMARMDVLMTMSSVGLAEGIADAALVLAVRQHCTLAEVLARLADEPVEAGPEVQAAVERRMMERGLL